MESCKVLLNNLGKYWTNNVLTQTDTISGNSPAGAQRLWDSKLDYTTSGVITTPVLPTLDALDARRRILNKLNTQLGYMARAHSMFSIFKNLLLYDQTLDFKLFSEAVYSNIQILKESGSKCYKSWDRCIDEEKLADIYLLAVDTSILVIAIPNSAPAADIGGPYPSTLPNIVITFDSGQSYDNEANVLS